MTIFQAIVLGVLQGLAEFLPISSSAHLSLAPWLLGWRDPGLAFDVALHLGTLAAVLWYFRAEWARLVAAALRIAASRPAEVETTVGGAAAGGGASYAVPARAVARRRFLIKDDEERRVLFLALATVPGAIGGLLLEDYAETVFRTPLLTAAALIVMGGLLWAADRFAPNDRPLGRMRWHDALLIGVAQVAALVPGVSRSGSTMTAGRALGFDRQSAAVFSFLMSMPITSAAAVLKVPEAVRESGVSAPLVAGVLAAGVSSWLAIAVLLRYLARHSFGVFALYRLALGLVVIALSYARG